MNRYINRFRISQVKDFSKTYLVAFELLADMSAVIWTNQSILRSVELLSQSDSRLNSWKSEQTQLSSKPLIPQQLILDLLDGEHDDVSDVLQLVLGQWCNKRSSCCGTRGGCGGLCSSEQCQNLWGDFRRSWLENVLSSFSEWPLHKVNIMHKMIHQEYLFSV